jgi:ribosomal protein L31E
MRKKPTGKIKQTFIMIVPLTVLAEFTWTGRAKLNVNEITKRVLSEFVRIFSLVEEIVTEIQKTVEIGAKVYVRRVKEWSKNSK